MSLFGRLFGQLFTKKSQYITPGLEEKSKAPEPVTDTQEQARRKAESENRLRGEGVPFDPDLPPVPPESQLRLRSAQEVADRALALTLVAMKGDGWDHDIILEIANVRNALSLFTSEELKFIHNPEPSEDDKIQFAHHFEAAWTLVWSLRLIHDPLSTPRHTCDAKRLTEIVRDTRDLTINELRRPCRLLDKLDLFQRYDWAVRQSIAADVRPPGQIEAIVALERYHALRWLTCTDGQEQWDELKLAA